MIMIKFNKNSILYNNNYKKQNNFLMNKNKSINNNKIL
jgi:hypothetical protein